MASRIAALSKAKTKAFTHRNREASKFQFELTLEEEGESMLVLRWFKLSFMSSECLPITMSARPTHLERTNTELLEYFFRKIKQLL